MVFEAYHEDRVLGNIHRGKKRFNLSRITRGLRERQEEKDSVTSYDRNRIQICGVGVAKILLPPPARPPSHPPSHPVVAELRCDWECAVFLDGQLLGIHQGA